MKNIENEVVSKTRRKKIQAWSTITHKSIEINEWTEVKIDLN